MLKNKKQIISINFHRIRSIAYNILRSPQFKNMQAFLHVTNICDYQKNGTY